MTRATADICVEFARFSHSLSDEKNDTIKMHQGSGQIQDVNLKLKKEKTMSDYWVNIESGSTVNLRSSNETGVNNVIAKLPRGTHVVKLYPISNWDYVKTDEGKKGYIQGKYLSAVYIALDSGNPWDIRYGTTVWKKSLHSGTKYTAVSNIQTDLRKIGYSSITKTDGYYGSITESAVKNFQRNQGLTVDGYFGNKSKSALWNHPRRA